jgi:hypothetical protein
MVYASFLTFAECFKHFYFNDTSKTGNFNLYDGSTNYVAMLTPPVTHRDCSVRGWDIGPFVICNLDGTSASKETPRQN